MKNRLPVSSGILAKARPRRRDRHARALGLAGDGGKTCSGLIWKVKKGRYMTSGDRVLITGATGFVGSAVARVVAKRGFKVRILVRPSSPRANLEGVACEIVEGDMMDALSMTRALK